LYFLTAKIFQHKIISALDGCTGRVGIVHMLHDSDDWRHAITCWVNSSLPAELVPHANKFDVMMKAFCKPLLAFLVMPGRAKLPQVRPPFPFFSYSRHKCLF
jgi:hypothetical protein